MSVNPSSRNQSSADQHDVSPRLVWFLHAGGVPLPVVGAQLSALGVLGTPMAYFDHDTVMFEQATQTDSRSFRTYVEALLRNHPARFSAFVPIADLPWLEGEPVIRDLLKDPSGFVHLCFRDPVLQAIGLLAAWTTLPPSDGLDKIWFQRIADALMLLEKREAMARTWVAGRGGQMVDLTVEDLAAPGVVALRHLLDRWSLALPKTARLHSITRPNTDHLAIVDAFRAEAERRDWGHALLARPPHWRRQIDL